jgi:hypothetical protein
MCCVFFMALQYVAVMGTVTHHCDMLLWELTLALEDLNGKLLIHTQNVLGSEDTFFISFILTTAFCQNFI